MYIERIPNRNSPPAILLRESYRRRTRRVTLVPVEPEITTQQAAELLNVSRPYVIGLIDKGTLSARMVGNHRRLPLKDVLAYKADSRAKRRQTLQELAVLDQELGLE